MEHDVESRKAITELKRRDFLKGAALGAMGMVAVPALFGCSTQQETPVAAADEPTAEPAAAAAPIATSGTPEAIAALGGSTMSLLELNAMREELVASKGDYTCEDGTVIPAAYHKLRTLINAYGRGCGSEISDAAFGFYTMSFTEEEAQAYIEMPYGVMFDAGAFADKSGRDEAECLEICESLSKRGLLWRARRAGVPMFHHVTTAHGIIEYNLYNYFEEGWLGSYLGSGTDAEGPFNSGTPIYYAIPCDKSVVADEEILPLDDYKKVVARNTVIGVSPCQCRSINLSLAGESKPPAVGSDELKDFTTPLCGHPLETCLTFGEEAEYYIENGIARQIDQDEALKILARSVDAGMVIQSCFTKDTGVICSCHGDCCGILGAYVAVGPEVMEQSSVYPNLSHYNLVHDKDACIKCGACAARCPMFAITMDGEDGLPQKSASCIGCGQCGTVCPASARMLESKPKDSYLELPDTMLDAYSISSGYRYEHGLTY